MATFTAINCKHQSGGAMRGTLDYVSQKKKTLWGDAQLVAGHNCFPQSAYAEMLTTKQQFRKTDGRQFYHFVQSFAEDDPITPAEANAIGLELAQREFPGFEVVIATHVVKCRAVDAYGAASPWSAIVFFVADDVGGGMTLTSANSFIEETGINFQDDGETIYGYITEYTFDVPAVSGHNGSDYGKVEAYNIRTGQWDQIAYKETNNGVTLSGKLPTGTYTQMRFYYYTNHDCMYNKSNITYSIVFDF